MSRAYATLGLRRGCSASELKKQYRTLVKRWHPDQYVNDPRGQIEAAQRMSQINQSFAVVAASLTRAAPAPRGAAAARAGNARPHADWGARPLSRSELDDIIRAIGDDRPVLVGLRVLAWAGPMAAAYVVTQGHGQRSPPTAIELLMGAVLFSFGLTVLVRRKWFKRR